MLFALTLIALGTNPARELPALPRLRQEAFSSAAQILERQGLPLAPPAPSGQRPAWEAHVAYGAKALWLSVQVDGAASSHAGTVRIGLFFPSGDVAGEGTSLSFGEGQTAPEGSKAKLETTPAGARLTAVLPPISWPRFPARGPVRLDLCISLITPSGKAEASNCEAGKMTGWELQMPSGFREELGVTAPKNALTLKARPQGWLGFDAMTSPLWVRSSSTITPESLEKILGEASMDPASARIAVPPSMSLPNKGLMVPLLFGQNPFREDGTCDGGRVLRLVLFLIKGKTAERVLEWPASSCAGGRATSVTLDEEGALTIGYESGGLVTFTWSTDHFERTEMGKR